MFTFASIVQTCKRRLFPLKQKSMNIIWKGSPNFTPGRKGFSPTLIIVHVMGGTLLGTDAWFNNPKSQVSAHYGIGLNGEIHGYVKEEDTAWHCGVIHNPTFQGLVHVNGVDTNPNKYTVGIENEGTGTSEWTDKQYDVLSDLIVDICKRNAIPIDRSHIIGHREIYDKHDCPGKCDLDKLVQICLNKSLPA